MNTSEPGSAGAVVRRWRAQHPRVRTQRQHARCLGFQASHLSRIETGRRPITYTEAKRLLEPVTRDAADLRRAILAYVYAEGWLELDQFLALWKAAQGGAVCACRTSGTFLEELPVCAGCGVAPACDGTAHTCQCDPDTVKGW